MSSFCSYGCIVLGNIALLSLHRHCINIINVASTLHQNCIDIALTLNRHIDFASTLHQCCINFASTLHHHNHLMAYHNNYIIFPSFAHQLCIIIFCMIITAACCQPWIAQCANIISICVPRNWIKTRVETLNILFMS